jgi:predicted CXXCH cytochrome family protein
MTISYLMIFFVILFTRLSFIEPVFQKGSKEDCLSCHGDLVKNTVVHPDLATSCDICHTPTGEEHPKTGKKGFSLSEKIPVLCFNCHSDFQEKFEKFPFLHGAVKDSVSCMNCHNPHSSSEPKLVLSSSNDLCLKCHNKTIRNDGKVITNIGQVLSRAKSIHPAIESGGCVSCHNPHFSEKRALLIGNFPEGQYLKADADKFELCFMCHDSDLLEAKTTESGTSFRNGKVNLHFIHLQGEKGRNCTMCHDVHAGVNSKMIRDKVSFGSWIMNIKFTENENGGTCLTACHSERKYSRKLL